MQQNKGLWRVCVCLLLFLGEISCQGDSQTTPDTLEVGPRPSEPGAASLEGAIRSLFDDGSNVDLLASGETLRGTLSRGEREILGISVVEQPGIGFPDLVLTLDVSNPGADADLYCLPWSVTQQIGGLPSPRNNIWKSDHQQGLDIVFVSKNHSFFDITVSDRQTEDGDTERTSDMVCLILGHSLTEAQYEVTLQLDFEQRSLVEEEKDVLKSIYAKCCEDGNHCQKWSAVSLEVQGGSSGGVEYDLCHMHNSFCDEGGHLIRLDMTKFGLECEFPSDEFAKLTKMKKLLLSSNVLTGDINTILEDLGPLKELDELILRENRIEGSLASSPQISASGICALAQQSLEVLNLDDNQIEGPIPPCMFESGSKLLSVFLDSNPLYSIIPDVFPVDSPIESLSAAESGIRGSIPASIANLQNLVSLDFRRNNLVGSIPANFIDSQHLVSVALQSNQLTGSVPDALASSQSLRFLNLNDNSLSVLPQAWFQGVATNEKLFNLGLARNNFQGIFPIAVAYAPNLVGVDFTENQISGPLPDVPDGFPSAVLIDFSFNEFSGTIPSSWSSMGLFSGKAMPPRGMPAWLDLSGNNLVGRVPDFLLDIDAIPYSLSGGGVNVTGNSLDCIDVDDIEVLNHFDGAKSCEGSTESLQPDAQSATLVPLPAAGVPEASNEPKSTGPTVSSEDVPISTKATILSDGAKETESAKSSSASTSRMTIIIVVAAIAGVLLAAVIVAAVIMQIKRRNAKAAAVHGAEGVADAKAMKNIEFEVFQDNV